MQIDNTNGEYLFYAIEDDETDLYNLFTSVFREFTVDKIQNAYNRAKEEYVKEVVKMWERTKKERAKREEVCIQNR